MNKENKINEKVDKLELIHRFLELLVVYAKQYQQPERLIYGKNHTEPDGYMIRGRKSFREFCSNYSNNITVIALLDLESKIREWACHEGGIYSYVKDFKKIKFPQYVVQEKLYQDVVEFLKNVEETVWVIHQARIKQMYNEILHQIEMFLMTPSEGFIDIDNKIKASQIFAQISSIVARLSAYLSRFLEDEDIKQIKRVLKQYRKELRV